MNHISPYPANVENIVAPTNAGEWRMGFDSAFKGLIVGRMCIFNYIVIVITFFNMFAVCCAMLFSNVGNYQFFCVAKKLGVLPSGNNWDSLMFMKRVL